MLAKRALAEQGFKTWIEIDQNAIRRNCDTFRKIIGPKAKLWSVVKSNAYGHGLSIFAKAAEEGVDGFCVDSVIEGLRLRKEKIKKPILVLGPTFPARLAEGTTNDIALTVSSFEALKSLLKSKNPPTFHLKIDTGMNRQGFYLEDLPAVIRFLKPKTSHLKPSFKGIYTHFASAKDINYPTYTEVQFKKFEKANRLFEKAGYKNLIKHSSATGATLVDKKYHLDAVRIGIGLYGLWPSKELEIHLPKIRLWPVLSWRAVLSEVKQAAAESFVGYDLTERLKQSTKIAVLPVGYWHGFPRGLSNIGEAIVCGKRAKVLGRVSMDLTTLNVQNIVCRPGDVVTLVGRDREAELKAFEVAEKLGTVHYEFLTRLNPLIQRVLA
ncbi:MAG: alanine racemase [Candidatus Liptonbacteria bacterium]|nr:alanine racemase [Candidatus Liptonbacteria bacterium]